MKFGIYTKLGVVNVNMARNSHTCWIDIYGPILNGSSFFAVYWHLYAFVGFVLHDDFVLLWLLAIFMAFCDFLLRFCGS